MRHDDFVAVLQHPGDAFVHDVQRSVALFVAHLADLEQNVLAAGRHVGGGSTWGLGLRGFTRITGKIAKNVLRCRFNTNGFVMDQLS